MMPHADPTQLVRVAAGEADVTAARHVAECATCASAVREIASKMDVLRIATAAPSSSACPDDFMLAAFVDGALDEVDHAQVVAHSADCPHCAAIIGDTLRAIADRDVSHELSLVASRRAFPWRRLALPLATAAAILLLLTPPQGTGPHRSSIPVTEYPAAALVAPVGSVADVASLRWNPVPMADRYRVTLYADDGATVYDAETTDAHVTLPDSVRLIPGLTYFWTVSARTDFDRWTRSDFAEFTIREGR